jgi:hypothetical protein
MFKYCFFVFLIFPALSFAAGSPVASGTIPADPPRIVLGADGQDKVLIFGEARDKSEIGFDVDGDKLTEQLNDKLSKLPAGDLIDVQVSLSDTASANIKGMISSVTRNNPSIEYSDVDGINMLFIMADASAIQELAKLPFVKTILPNTHVGGIIMDGAKRYTGIDFAATAAVNIGKPNGLHDQASRINGDMDQNINSYSSSDSVIAIIDTGIDDSHPAFPGNAGQPGAKVLYWQDFNRPEDGYTPCSAPCDDTGHGTHVAGIASGSNNSIYDGVAPGSALVILKGLKLGGFQGSYTTYPWTPGGHKDPFTLALEWVNNTNNINNVSSG